MGRHPKPIDVEQIAALFAARSEGLSAREIGARVGLSAGVVLKTVARFRDHGDPRAAYLNPFYRRAAPADDLAEARRAGPVETANRRHLADLARAYPAGPASCPSLTTTTRSRRPMPARSIPLLHSPCSCGLE